MRDGLVKVDGSIVQREVKADVARREQFVKRKRQQVFARVLLHEIKAARPVDLTRDHLADRKRAIDAMIDFARLLADVENGCVP